MKIQDLQEFIKPVSYKDLFKNTLYLKKIEWELLTFKSGNPKQQPNFNWTSHASWAIKPFGIYEEIWDSEP